ncbi:lanC-like protein GCL2 isoform X3 [Physcomitrium patens]|uniref:lanC-like protein GCL2 isoform X3 n=1 Tax=Physcomitrium patens TaxID=3218 RepID=UPI003CCD37BD
MSKNEEPLELIFNKKKKTDRHNSTTPSIEIRNFPNNMNDYKVAWRGSDEEIDKSQRVPLTETTAPLVALWIPPEFLEHSFPNSKTFIKSAMELKNEVVQATWIRNGPRVKDPTMYTGVLGTAFLCFKAYLATGSPQDLALFTEIVDSCCAAAPTHPDNVTFLRGQAGIYAMGAVAAKIGDDKTRRDFFLDHFKRGPVVDAVLASGRAHATPECPLMYPWKSRRYFGASHGLAGIIQILLHFPLTEQDNKDIKGTLHYIVKKRYSRGNYRVSVEDERGDRLVHWCQGAPGITMTLCKALEVFPVDNCLGEAAEAAADVVWERGLLRRLGICHGVSGNTYVFLAMYRSIGGKKHLFRARQFAGWLHKHAKRLLSTGEMHGGDHRHSLFEGLAGTACSWKVEQHNVLKYSRRGVQKMHLKKCIQWLQVFDLSFHDISEETNTLHKFSMSCT